MYRILSMLDTDDQSEPLPVHVGRNSNPPLTMLQEWMKDRTAGRFQENLGAGSNS